MASKQTNPEKPKWLVLFFMHNAVNPQTEDALVGIKNEMKAAGNDGCEVLLIIDEIDRSMATQPFKTGFMRLTRDKTNPEIFDFITIEDADIDFTFSKERSWKKLLKWINKHYPFEKTIMITLSHGAGFGLPAFTAFQKPNSGNLLTPRVPLFIPAEYKPYVETLKIPINEHSIHSVKELGYDKVLWALQDKTCKALEMLWISELSLALKGGFGKRKIDIMMMANCYMQTFETGWLLGNQVRYLVAPETGIGINGYAFGGLLTTIYTQRNTTPRKLLKTIIPQFIGKWSSSDATWGSLLRRANIVINDLQYYPILKEIFEKIISQIIGCSKEELLEIIRLRCTEMYNVSDNPPPHHRPADDVEFIDLNYFLDILVRVFDKNDMLHSDIKNFQKVAKESLVHMFVGSAFLDHDNLDSEKKKFRISGISIYLPSNIEGVTFSVNCGYFGSSTIPTNNSSTCNQEPPPLGIFTCGSCWDEFIVKYSKALSSYVSQD